MFILSQQTNDISESMKNCWYNKIIGCSNKLHIALLGSLKYAD